ncbi:carboxynorspermidine decarboxylase [Prevotella nigrescens]|uniref:carboxynorspermidine decarboxylase n=1 Tax=Prevotella nigrescens TaxID=28133 RepID=UPI0002182E50|nr:carboxynorspermidine decarboxylase [Prevotella nigrescens]EGQ17071.1 carboxynorspermidine decarboxylase [Prevotella nigrescens ATCC 33563]UAK27628.1 carboxynorspermidine decarboxylase [Prevotella nigrescens]WMS21634.1 carboxynorspermidine decarboxylase [Prevotella nigrescens]SUB92203.1 Diaminopimelate decarboxylase [Prevotella nigrescens]
MKINTTTFEELHRPVYILEEAKLRNNLSLISSIAKEADIEIILAFKAYALWKTFPIFREYINATTASSLYETKLGYNEFGAPTHTFSPAYTDYEIDEIAQCSSHLVFNSLSQFNRFHLQSKQANSNISIGLRVNPEYSEVETLLYNPCAAGTRFGVSADKLPQQLPADIEGFHIHCHCESGSDVFERTLQHIEDKFSQWFKQIKWINFGGGHLMTRKGYDIKRLVSILQKFKTKYPHLKVILEPGSAFAWQTGSLVSQVVDIVEDKGISTAILNVSFTCHMPDCLEMPYYPDVRTAKHVKDSEQHAKNVYRLGGNSCLSGDWMGYWRFDHELQVGENIIFEDMLHYTTVKTNMFNGITHPDIALLKQNGELETLRNFTYSDYKQRMD